MVCILSGMKLDNRDDPRLLSTKNIYAAIINGVANGAANVDDFKQVFTSMSKAGIKPSADFFAKLVVHNLCTEERA